MFRALTAFIHHLSVWFAKRHEMARKMKNLLLLLILLPGLLWAQATTETARLPDAGFGAILWYNESGDPQVNGTLFMSTHVPHVAEGTYWYNAVDFISEGQGIIVAVPQTGIAQHIAWINDRTDLFALVAVGMSFAPTTTPAGAVVPPGSTNITPAFAAGGGFSYTLGHGISLQPTVKIIHAQDMDTLVGGLGIRWDEFPSAETLTRRAQVKAAKAAAKARKK